MTGWVSVFGRDKCGAVLREGRWSASALPVSTVGSVSQISRVVASPLADVGFAPFGELVRDALVGDRGHFAVVMGKADASDTEVAAVQPFEVVADP